MFSSLRNIFIIAILTLFISNIVKAQPRKGEFIDASIGYGLSLYSNDLNISGSGFYAQGEYVLGLTKWFGIRPYAGFIITSPDKNINQQNQPEYRVTSKALLVGGKARVCAPIPWFAPYFEVGIGTSIGSFETYTPYSTIKKNGMLMHIPWSIGVALGPKHNIEVAFTYYEQPSVDQVCGAAAFGFTFPLN